MDPKPACQRCRHYYITYDPSRPHGCRAYKFKSRENPAQTVLTASGLPCRMFDKKNPAPGHSRRPD
ncbi:MAG: hypothetical protein GXO34_03315 [Deltaproteobacteria bacterium]|nr:hypothetical protein [Deltaproteobacteria bacterium]